MDIFGIGIPEILFILLIALLVMGPEDLEKTGRTLGKGLRALVQSETWQMLRRTGKELQELPTRLMREANEDLPADLRTGFGAWEGVRTSLEETQHALDENLRQPLAWPPPTDAATESAAAPQQHDSSDDDKEPPAP